LVYSSTSLLRERNRAEEIGVRVVRITIGLLLCALVAAPIAGARAGDGPYPGTYAGKGKGVKVTLQVSDRGDGSLRYSMRSGCGSARGKVDLGAPKHGGFAAKRVSAGPHRSIRRVTVRVASAGDGTMLRGTIGMATTATAHAKACETKRSFKAALGKADTLVPPRDEGHYAGADGDGRPISFDVVGDPKSGDALITNLAADVAGECVDVVEFDELVKVVHLGGLEASIDSSGEVYGEWVEGDNEFEVFGELNDGVARLEIWIDAFFTPTGVPDPVADLYCANEGAEYVARRGSR
jgi:hypothetical protein